MKNPPVLARFKPKAIGLLALLVGLCNAEAQVPYIQVSGSAGGGQIDFNNVYAHLTTVATNFSDVDVSLPAQNMSPLDFGGSVLDGSYLLSVDLLAAKLRASIHAPSYAYDGREVNHTWSEVGYPGQALAQLYFVNDKITVYGPFGANTRVPFVIRTRLQGTMQGGSATQGWQGSGLSGNPTYTFTGPISAHAYVRFTAPDGGGGGREYSHSSPALEVAAGGPLEVIDQKFEYYVDYGLTLVAGQTLPVPYSTFVTVTAESGAIVDMTVSPEIVLPRGYTYSSLLGMHMPVTYVNGQPSFTDAGNVAVPANSGPQAVANWATAISAGPADEGGQTVSFLVTGNSNPALFSAGPSVQTNGTLTFTSAQNVMGSALVTVVMIDSGGTTLGGLDTSTPHTFIINVTAANQAPVANAQSVTTSATTPVAITLTGSDADGNPLSYSVLTGPTHGLLSGTAPNLTCTPTTGFGGPDSFTFKVNDGFVDSAPATVSITVTPVNTAPLAADDAYTTDEDTVLNVASPGLLRNDTDPDAGPLVRFSFAGHVVSADADFSAGERFTGFYMVDPAATRYDIADSTLTYQYRSDNVAWEISFPDRGYRYVAGSAYTWILVGNDISIWGDRYIADLTSALNIGTPLPSGRVLSTTQLDLWDPASAGADLLTDDSVQTTSINLAGAQSPAGRLAFRDGTQPQLTIDQLVGPMSVTQVNGQAASVNTPITLASGATLRVNGNGSFNYDPRGHFDQLRPGATATETFTYEVSDREGATANATVTITITGVNDTPVVSHAIPDQSAVYGAAFSATFPANTFSDADAAQPLTYSVSGMPSGILFDAGTRTFSGTPTVIGTFPVTATATDDSVPPMGASTTFNLVVGKAVLTVTADNFTRLYGEPNLPLTGTLVAVVNGDNITASYSTAATPAGAAGVYTIYVTLNDPDNKLGNYTVALINGALRVNPVSQTITLGPIPAHTYGDVPFGLTAIASSGLPLTINSLTPSVATVSGNTVTVVGAGDAFIIAYQFGGGGYLAATPVGQALTVAKATPVVTWANPADIVYGTALGGAQLNAVANVPGTFVFSPPAGTVLNAENGQTLSAMFTPDDSANYNTVSATASITILNATPAIASVSPASVAAAGSAFALTVNGTGLDSGTTVLWNGSPRPTTYVSPTQVTAEIPAGDLQVAGDIVTALITVRNSAGLESGSLALSITGPTVASVQSAVASAGQSAIVSAVPTVAGAAGVKASFSNGGDPAPATLTAATYTGNPMPAPVFDAGGGFVDVRVAGADPGDTAVADFYYPSTMTGATEQSLQLLYYDGAAWGLTRSSGDTDPAKDITDNLDSTVSGGRFLVTFDNTSTPKITELGGTVFATTVVQPPSITTQPQGLSVLAGAAATFTVIASGHLPLSCQWLRNGVEMAGQTGATLNLANVSALDAADYSVRVSNIAGKVVSQAATLAVSKRTPVITWPIPAAVVYGTPLGAGQLNAAADVPGNLVYTPAVGTVLLSGNAQVLSVTFTPTDGDRYRLVTASVALSVAKASLTIRANDLSKIYGASLPTPTASYAGFVNGDTTSSLSSQPVLATSATAASPAGTYPITISGATAADYTITLVPGTLTVAKAPLAIAADNKTKAYGAGLPTLSLTYSGFVNGDTAAKLATQPVLATTALKASPVGAYPITVTGATAANYAITQAPGVLSVTPVSLTITAANKTKVYGNAVPALTATYSGFVNGDSAATLDTPVTLTATALTNSSVGSYPIVASGASDANYVINCVNGTLTVTPRPLTIAAQNKTMTYGAALPALTAAYSGLAPGETAADVDVPPALSTAAISGSGVGTYPITISGASDPNYTIILVNGTLTVNQASLTVRAVNKSKTYGAVVPALSYTATGFVNGDTEASLDTPVTISTTGTANSPVGTYPIVVGGASDANYKVTFANGTLTVSKATLTISADSKSKVYGASLPALTYAITGFVLGEAEANLATPVATSTTGTATSSAGTYPINVSGASSANYTITFKSGTLTVSKAPLTITADSKTKKQGTANPPFTASYSGFVNGDTAASLTTLVSFSTTAITSSKVGNYPITPKGAASSNYAITFVNGTLIITP